MSIKKMYLDLSDSKLYQKSRYGFGDLVGIIWKKKGSELRRFVKWWNKKAYSVGAYAEHFVCSLITEIEHTLSEEEKLFFSIMFQFKRFCPLWS